MTSRQFHSETENTADAIDWCKQFGLIAAQRICAQCAMPMVWSARGGRTDGFQWRCGRPCQKRLTIRTGTFFERSHLSIRDILDIIFYWSYEEFTFRKAVREMNLGEHTFVDWRNYLRDICAEHLIRNPTVIGGVGITVQIDESVFVRRKANVGRMPVPQQWVFGGVDCASKEGFLVTVPRRDAATLLAVLQQYVRPGTTVVSDLWAAYNTIGNLGYQHLTVNHSVNFVDPVTGAHTNEVENMWMRAKRRNKKECGTARSLLDSYLLEFMWRLKFGDDPFEQILADIRVVYPQ